MGFLLMASKLTFDLLRECNFQSHLITGYQCFAEFKYIDPRDEPNRARAIDKLCNGHNSKKKEHALDKI